MTASTAQRPRARVAGGAATVSFLGIAVFQAALALGAPFGRAAWGGSSADLTARLRVASAIAVVLWLLAAAIVAQRSGLRNTRLGGTFVRQGTWALVGIVSVSTLMNLASRSALERSIWAPIGLVMTTLCLIVARSAEPDPSVPVRRGSR
ncbi:MAG TPA: hypothetical protein VIM19_12305 [Actinomycetes bacterium]